MVDNQNNNFNNDNNINMELEKRLNEMSELLTKIKLN